MQIKKTLFDNLMDKLKRLPITQTKDGRDTLLSGIPHIGWQRNENTLIDIHVIIQQSQEVHAGEKEELENWGPILLIDNALKTVEGSSLATDLKNLRRECIVCWEQEHPQLELLISAELQQPMQNYNKENGALSDPQVGKILKLRDAEGVLSSDIVPSIHEEIQVDPSKLFLDNFNMCVTSLQQSIDAAFHPFEGQPPDYVEPKDCRQSLSQLKQSERLLYQLSTLIDTTNPLPSVVEMHSTELVEQIQFLTDQTNILIRRIDKGCKTDREIKAEFSTIKQELKSFLFLVNNQKEENPQ